MVTSARLINGSVFSAMKTDINNRNQADLAAEEERDRVNNLNNATALVGENKFLVSDNALGSGSGKVVLFDDLKTKQRVALRLDEAYINYIKGGDNSFGTIQDALNAILAKDKNLDGNLERFEEYKDEEEAKKDAIRIAQRAIGDGKNMMDDMVDDILGEHFSGEWITALMDKLLKNNKKLTDNIKKMMEEYKKQQIEKQEKGETSETEKSLKELQAQQQALQKLKNNGGNVNALNAEEKKSLANLTQKDMLSNEEMQDLQKQVDTNSFKAISESIGVDKEDLQKVFKAL
ncbi:hypothetical protein [Helicobacter mesocricetorum]|uniref:hypothetical protein n=1 Tax=Helicobacter mesocricetorum TaxID=87012 RepID=UPI000CF02F5F|nr:hypothetical protein [Helicobacter mesocricetorum]